MLQCAPGYCLALPAAAAALSAAESVPQAVREEGGGREGHTATMKRGHTAGRVGEERREHTRTGDLEVSSSQSEQLLEVLEITQGAIARHASSTGPLKTEGHLHLVQHPVHTLPAPRGHTVVLCTALTSIPDLA